MRYAQVIEVFISRAIFSELVDNIQVVILILELVGVVAVKTSLEKSMFLEAEIKLRISSETVSAIKEHPLLKQRQIEGWRSGIIYNQYYDTPDKQLASEGVALRMRRDGDQYIQTLKYNADGLAGMSVRQEWDWYLKSPDLDISLLDSSCWPKNLKNLDKSRLAPIFRTDFKRTRSLIRWQRDRENIEVEAAIDEGSIETAEGSELICELELEVRKGPDVAIFELAQSLAKDTSLMPCDLSKSERGYRLLAPTAPSDDRELPKWPGTVKVRTVMRDIGQVLLADIVSLSEHFHASRDRLSFHRLHRKLGMLHQYFQIFRCNIPKTVRKELFEHTDAFFDDHQVDVSVSLKESDRYDHAEAIFSGWIESNRWGQLLIGFGRWLHSELSGSVPPHAAREDMSDHVVMSWLKNEIGRTEGMVTKPLDSCSTKEALMKNEMPPRLLFQRLFFIFGSFWSFLDIDRPSSLMRELEEVLSSNNRVPLGGEREQELLDRSLRELQVWDRQLASKIHQYVF